MKRHSSLTLLVPMLVLLSPACVPVSVQSELAAQADMGANAVVTVEAREELATLSPETVETTATPTSEPTVPPSPTPELTATPVAEFAPTEAARPDSPIKIALLDALELEDGQARLHWGQMAVGDFNQATGWDVELVAVDMGWDITTAGSALTLVLDDKAIYTAIGPGFAGQLMYVVPTLEAAGLPHIIFSGFQGLSPSNTGTLFRMAPSDELQAPAAAHFMVERLGANKILVLVPAEGGLYTQDLVQALEQALTPAGGSLVGREFIASNMQDFGPLIDSIKASGAEVVFGAGGTSEQGGLLAQTMRQAEVEAALVSHYGWATPRFMALAEGAYVVSPAPAVYDVAAAADLVQRYKQQHGSFAVDGPVIYEAVTVALEAIQRAAEGGNLTRKAVRDEIAGTNHGNSILGRPVAFETDGNLKEAQFYILQVENGTFKTVAP